MWTSFVLLVLLPLLSAMDSPVLPASGMWVLGLGVLKASQPSFIMTTIVDKGASPQFHLALKNDFDGFLTTQRHTQLPKCPVVPSIIV